MSLAALGGVLLALGLEALEAFDHAAVPVPGWAAALSLLLALGLALRWPPRPRWRCALALLAGLWFAGTRLCDWHAHQLSEAAEGRVLVIADIVSLPEPQADGWRFIARLLPARAEPAALAGAPHWPLQVRLRWARAGPLHVGDRWQFIVQLAALQPARNPAPGWFGRSELRAGLQAAGQVVDSRLTQPLPPAAAPIDRAREWLSARIRAQVAERDAAALLAALAVGDTRFVSREQWRVFNAVGITHLIAISGLHVTLFGVLCAALARRLWSLCPWLWRHVRREHCAALAATGAAAGYALLSGFSVPAQRTLLMLATWQGLRCAARPGAVAPALAVALLCVLLLDPLAPLAAGFWLSFVAVAVLMHAGAADVIVPRDGEPAAGRLRRAARRQAQRLVAVLGALWTTQWRVALGLLPVTLAVFGSTSLAGLLVNLAAIPLFSFVLVPLVLLSLPLLAGAPHFAAPLLAAAAWVAQGLQPVLERIADWPWALWHIDAAAWVVLLALPAAWLLLLPGRWCQRGSALCMLLPLCWPVVDAPATGEFRATVLDTGRSLALIVRTSRHALLYDVGEHWGSGGAVSESVVVPALRALHVRRLDRVLLPRIDRDRGAGVAVIDAAFPVGVWQAGGAESDRPPEFAPCARGERWNWDGVEFENLASDECVLRIGAAIASVAPAAARARSAPTAPTPSLLVAGELDRAGQARLVALGLGASDALILPRHGAGSAYLGAFRDAVAPRFAIVPQSVRGASAASVRGTLSAFRDVGAQVWITGEQGAVTLRGTVGMLHVAPAGR